MTFRFKREQMEVFAKYCEESFINRVMRGLQTRFQRELAAWNLQEHGLDPWIRRIMAEAQTYGLESEFAIERYIEYMLVLGPEFPQGSRHPWALQILKRRDLTEGEKIDQLDQHLIFSTTEDVP